LQFISCIIGRRAAPEAPAFSPVSRNKPMKQEPTSRPQNMASHLSPPLQQRYLLPSAAGMLPAPAHMGFLPTSQSQLHIPTHPLPAHLPAFLQQGATPFTMNASHAAYLTHGMIGGLPTAASLAAARSTHQAAFPGYIYPTGYD